MTEHNGINSGFYQNPEENEREEKEGESMHENMQLIQSWFTYHRPHGDQPQRYERIRSAGLAFAAAVAENCEDTDTYEFWKAVDKIREAVMWANASMAVNEALPQDGDGDGK